MARTRQPAAVTLAPSNHSWEEGMGKFALGFIVAVILVIFIVVQCAQALF